MRKHLIVCCFLISIISSLYGQEISPISFLASSIKDSLKKNTNAVFRLDEGVLEVTSPSHYTNRVHQIVTILNEKGANHLDQEFGIDKFDKINDIEIKVYNSLGLEVKKYKKKDFSVNDAFGGVSLASDDKIMSLDIPSPGYPCTLDIQYTEELSSYIELPDWFIKTNTENFKYTVKVPSTLDIRQRTINLPIQPNISDDGKTKVYNWEAKNITIKHPDPNGYESMLLYPHIEVGANSFEYDGHKGDLRTWKDYGKWSYDLYEEQNPFSEARQAEIKSIAAPYNKINDKVNALYDYLKKNMRYVSIAFGIGGFKPFPVKFVDDKKYGDCKALTNYMRYLLDVVGIKSYPALINAGYNKLPVDPSFPVHVFNHVILCVPIKDTIWLECTSNSNLTGFLGSFTENKNALLLTENGGVLVRTPRSKPENNRLNTRTDLFIKEDGSADVTNQVYVTGDIAFLFNEIWQYENDKRKEFFIQYLKYKQSEEFTIKDKKDSSDGSVYNLELFFDKFYDFKAGDKLFFPQRISELSDEKLNPEDTRTTDYVCNNPYDKSDTTIFHLPAGFTIDNIPAPIELKCEYATYKREVVSDKTSNSVIVIAHLVLKSNIIPAKAYTKLAEFFNEVKKDEGQKLIFRQS
jgi:hypothetical protein